MMVDLSEDEGFCYVGRKGFNDAFVRNLAPLEVMEQNV